MARGPIKVAIASDTGAFEKGIKSGVIEPLEDADKTLEDLGRNKGADKLTAEMKEAQKAADKLGDEVDRTAESIEDSFRKSYKGVGDRSKEGMSAAAENAEEFKREAASNFSEVTSSFDGSMESILDLAQGTLGGLAGGISGPLGIALGIAAAGIGLLVNGLIEGEEATEEMREQARQFAVEAVNAGQSTDAWLTGAEQIVSRIQELEQLKATDWRWFWEKDPTQLQKWVDGLKATGRELDEVEGFLSSSREAQDEYRRSIEKARDAAMDQAEALAESTALADEAGMAKVHALEDEVDAYDDILQSIEQEITVRDEAKASADRQRDAGVESAQARIEAEEAAATAIEETQKQVQDSVTSAYDNMRQAAVDYATTEEGALDINRWLEYTQQNAAAVEAYRANVERIKLSPEQWTNLLEMPESQRMQWVDQFANLPESARSPFAAALNDVGSAGGNDAAVAFNEAFEPDTDVTVDVDTSDAAADLNDLATKKRTAEIDVKLTGRKEAAQSLDDLAKKRNATIDVDVNTRDASNGMSAWRRNQESRPVTITVNTRRGRTQLV